MTAPTGQCAEWMEKTVRGPHWSGDRGQLDSESIFSETMLSDRPSVLGECLRSETLDRILLWMHVVSKG